METKDLEQLAKSFDVRVNPPEKDDERAARLRSEEADAKHTRWKGTVGFFVALGGVVAIGWICVESLRNTAASPDAQKWAMTALAAMVSGGLGYLTGRKTT
jgi:hypothetical protein